MRAVFARLHRIAAPLKGLFFAFALLFAQQAAQLHALAHAQSDLAQPHKAGHSAGHPVERCIAFHAVGSALTSNTTVQLSEARYSEGAPWFVAATPRIERYRLPVRAPPLVV